MLRFDPDAGIDHLKLSNGLSGKHSDAQRETAGAPRVFHHGVLRVGDQVDQYLQDLVSIRHHHRDWTVFPYELDVVFLRLGERHHDRLFHEIFSGRRLTDIPCAGNILL